MKSQWPNYVLLAAYVIVPWTLTFRPQNLTPSSPSHDASLCKFGGNLSCTSSDIVLTMCRGRTHWPMNTWTRQKHYAQTTLRCPDAKKPSEGTKEQVQECWLGGLLINLLHSINHSGFHASTYTATPLNIINPISEIPYADASLEYALEEANKMHEHAPYYTTRYIALTAMSIFRPSVWVAYFTFEARDASSPSPDLWLTS